MFTGITHSAGVVADFMSGKNSWKLSIRVGAGFPAIKKGGSISVNGACLTLVKKLGTVLWFDVIAETVRRTSFSGLKKGMLVNLEPALRWNDRIEGHFVQGHVDGVGVILEIGKGRSDVHFKIQYPPRLRSLLLEKGSVAVNGVSLTLGQVNARYFSVYLIPHTLQRTNFSRLKKGDAVNLEMDLLIKFFKAL